MARGDLKNENEARDRRRVVAGLWRYRLSGCVENFAVNTRKLICCSSLEVGSLYRIIHSLGYHLSNRFCYCQSDQHFCWNKITDGYWEDFIFLPDWVKALKLTGISISKWTWISESIKTVLTLVSWLSYKILVFQWALLFPQIVSCSAIC